MTQLKKSDAMAALRVLMAREPSAADMGEAKAGKHETKSCEAGWKKVLLK